jgi:hypothetical protein
MNLYYYGLTNTVTIVTTSTEVGKHYSALFAFVEVPGKKSINTPPIKKAPLAAYPKTGY